MLHGRARHLLVDDFSLETAEEFLRESGFSDKEIRLTLEYFGGKPVYLVEAIKNRHRLEEFCERMKKMRVSQIMDAIYRAEDKGVVDVLKEIAEKEIIEYKKLEESMLFCIKENMLFADPIERILKPQSRLDLLAIREVLQ